MSTESLTHRSKAIADWVEPYTIGVEALAELRDRILADRFEVLSDPLGWRCLACRATVLAAEAESQIPAAARLAESAADHAMFCGRCDD